MQVVYQDVESEALSPSHQTLLAQEGQGRGRGYVV